MSKQYIDENEVRKAVSIFKKDSISGLFEVRIASKSKKEPTVGYFTDVNVMLEKLYKQNLRGKNVYIVMNEINKACYARPSMISMKTISSLISL